VEVPVGERNARQRRGRREQRAVREDGPVMHDHGDGAPVIADRRRHPRRPFRRQRHDPAALVDVVVCGRAPAPDRQRWIAEGASEARFERRRTGQLLEVDHETGECGLRPGCAQEIADEDDCDGGDREVVCPKHLRVGRDARDPQDGAEREHARKQQCGNERRAGGLARRPGGAEEDARRGHRHQRAQGDGQPIVSRERHDDPVQASQAHDDAGGMAGQPARRIGEMQLHEWPAVQEHQRPTERAGEPGDAACPHPEADSARGPKHPGQSARQDQGDSDTQIRGRERLAARRTHRQLCDDAESGCGQRGDERQRARALSHG
jgi:hypothetical protein